MIMRYSLSTRTAIFLLLIINGIQGTYWIDYDQPFSDADATFDDDSDRYLSALTRDEEDEIYSPLITGYKYVSGGAGEGRQHLSPSGEIPNRPEVKTDEELPTYCDPPNPCPLGYEAEDCDASPMATFTPRYSQLYQAEQNCQCDHDHDQCPTNSIFNFAAPSKNILKRSRRLRRVRSSFLQGTQAKAQPVFFSKDAWTKQQTNNDSKDHPHRNSIRKGQTLRFHVAKKSPINLSV